ncbi:MAG: tetratricopeptide repeat protein [Rhodothermaceae bacterium]|nr:tetratricopeptide repeat protein [Rhodothermaceae bacterium]
MNKKLIPVFLLIALLANPLNARQHDDPSSHLFLEGVRLYEEGLFTEAERTLGLYLRSEHTPPQRENALFYMVQAQAGQNPEHAAFYYEQFLQEYSHSQNARALLTEIGNLKKRDGSFSEAAMYYERAVKLNPPYEEAARIHYHLGESYGEFHDYDNAAANYNTIADRYSRSKLAPEALFALGRLYLNNKKFDESANAFARLRQLYPLSPEAGRVGTALGESYFQQGMYAEAVEALRGVLASLDEEGEARAVFLLAESSNYLGNYDQATTWYRRYINLKDDTEDVRFAHYGMGWVYHRQEVYHWAAESFGRAAVGDDELARKALYYQAVNEKLAGRLENAYRSFESFGNRFSTGEWIEEAYFEWAVIAFEVGFYGEAIEILLSMIRNVPELNNPGDVYTLLGEAYFANNEYTSAIAAFDAAESAVEIDDDIKRQARFQRAWVMYQNNAFAQAQPGFEQLYSEDPSAILSGEALFWSADSYYSMEDYGTALAQFDRFVREYPNHEFAGAAHYSIGWSYFKLGQYDRAIAPLRRFLSEYEAPPIQLFPYDTDTRLRLGDAQFAMRNYSEALTYYNQAVGAEPGGDYAMYQIANSYYRMEQSYEAVSTFRRLIRIYPYSTLREQAEYNIGYIYFLTGNYDQAVEEFNQLISRSPNSAWAARAQYNIGDAYYNANRNEEAIEAYRKVLRNYPRSDLIIEAVNGIQFAQSAMGDDDTSNQILEEFLAGNPQSRTADRLRFRQADNQLQAGDYNGAIASFRQYLRVTNDEAMIPEALFNLADAYEQTNNMDEAIESYRNIVENHRRSERYEPALTSLGRIYNDQGMYDEAIASYQRLIDTSTLMRFEANIGLGEGHLAKRDYNSAQQFFERANELTPNSETAKIGLGKVAFHRNNYDEARRIFSELAEQSTMEPGAEAQYMIGRIYQSQRFYDDAIQAYANVRVLFNIYEKWVARSLLRSAECYRAIGNSSEAENILRNIQESYPGTDEAREASQMLRGR